MDLDGAAIAMTKWTSIMVIGRMDSILSEFVEILILNKFGTDQSSDDEEYDASQGAVLDDVDNESDEAENQSDKESGVNWRDNLAQKARTAYLERQSNTKNLMKIVYGMFNEVSVISIDVRTLD